MTTFFTITLIITILSTAALYFSRHEPLRNGYQARVRTRMKGGKVVILEPNDDRRIVGDVTIPYRALMRERQMEGVDG